MKEVNRSLVVVKPRQPYVDWANSFMDDDEAQNIASFHRDCNVYLIDEIEEDGDEERNLKKIYRRIFEEELYAWMTDENVWPEKRDYPTFRTWFDVTFHSLVFDLGNNRLQTEES